MRQHATRQGIGQKCLGFIARGNSFPAFRATLLAIAFILAAEATTPARASIISIAPFVGDYSETWESFPNYTIGPSYPNYLASPTDIMGGFASIANGYMLIYQPNAGATFYLVNNGYAQVSDGLRGMGINRPNETTTLTFDAPLERFGAYWGAAQSGTDTDDITVHFSDGSSTVFNHNPAPPNGMLVWRGWESTIGITAITYSGDYVVIDGLQASEPDIIPEPSAFGLASLSALAFLRRTRR